MAKLIGGNGAVCGRMVTREPPGTVLVLDIEHDHAV